MTITDEGIRIELPFNNYSKRKDAIKKECYLHLYEEYVQYKIVATYTELDPENGLWAEKQANWRWTRRRDGITDVNMYYDTKEDQWSVGIEFSGVSGAGNEWVCSGPKEALTIYNKLVDYMTT